MCTAFVILEVSVLQTLAVYVNHNTFDSLF